MRTVNCFQYKIWTKNQSLMFSRRHTYDAYKYNNTAARFAMLTNVLWRITVGHQRKTGNVGTRAYSYSHRSCNCTKLWSPCTILLFYIMHKWPWRFWIVADYDRFCFGAFRVSPVQSSDRRCCSFMHRTSVMWLDERRSGGTTLYMGKRYTSVFRTCLTRPGGNCTVVVAAARQGRVQVYTISPLSAADEIRVL